MYYCNNNNNCPLGRWMHRTFAQSSSGGHKTNCSASLHKKMYTVLFFEEHFREIGPNCKHHQIRRIFRLWLKKNLNINIWYLLTRWVTVFFRGEKPAFTFCQISMLKSCRQSRGNMTEQDTEVVQQTTSLKKIQITVTHWKAFDNLHSSAELQSVCHWGNVWERPTCCHAWIYPVPYLSCGPYVYVPSLCTCLYACGSLKKQNSITILKQTHIDKYNTKIDCFS